VDFPPDSGEYCRASVLLLAQDFERGVATEMIVREIKNQIDSIWTGLHLSSGVLAS
jgi:hypothetical protein